MILKNGVCKYCYREFLTELPLNARCDSDDCPSNCEDFNVALQERSKVAQVQLYASGIELSESEISAFETCAQEQVDKQHQLDLVQLKNTTREVLIDSDCISVARSLGIEVRLVDDLESSLNVKELNQ